VTRPARKPLRRTAWSLLLGGLGVAGLMLGIGIHAVSQGESAGPDQTATWPAGSELAVFRPLGRQQDNGDDASIVCTVTPQGGRPMLVFPGWQQRMRPDFTGSATITCRQPVKVLTGPAITVAILTRGPLIAVPLFAAGLGVFISSPVSPRSPPASPTPSAASSPASPAATGTTERAHALVLLA
jgi:hypothetical protein